jgi:hypothetical protein
MAEPFDYRKTPPWAWDKSLAPVKMYVEYIESIRDRKELDWVKATFPEDIREACWGLLIDRLHTDMIRFDPTSHPHPTPELMTRILHWDRGPHAQMKWIEERKAASAEYYAECEAKGIDPRGDVAQPG